MTDNDQLRLFRVRRTCCEMLEDRGFVISDLDKTENFKTFQARFQQAEGQLSNVVYC